MTPKWQKLASLTQEIGKVSKVAKIRNRYNQVPHLKASSLLSKDTLLRTY